MLELIPIQIESRERAKPKIKASFKSIPRELSKSKGIGSNIITRPNIIKIPFTYDHSKKF